VVAPFDGVPTLMFRAANQRGNSILDAAVTVSLAANITLEGVEIRRFHELKLAPLQQSAVRASHGRYCTRLTRTARFTGSPLSRWPNKEMRSSSCCRDGRNHLPTISLPATPIGMTRSNGTGALWMWCRSPPAATGCWIDAFPRDAGDQPKPVDVHANRVRDMGEAVARQKPPPIRA